MKTNYSMKPILFSILIGLMVFCTTASAQGNYGYVLSGGNGYYSIAQFDVTTKTYTSSVSSFSDYAYTGTLNQRGTKLWVTANSMLYIINTATKLVVSQQSISSSSNSLSKKPAFSPDGSKAYMLSGSNPVYVDERDTATYQAAVSHLIQNANYARSAPVLSRDGNKLYFLDDNGYLYEVNTATWASRRASISYSFNKIKLSPNDSMIFAWGSGYSSIQAYKTSTLTSAGSLQASNSVSSIEFSQDGKTLFVGFEYYSSLQIYNISQFPSVSSTIVSLSNSCYDIARDPNSDSLLFIGHNFYSAGNVSVYNIPLGSITKSFSSSNYSYALVMPLKKDAIAPGAVTDLQASAINYDVVRLKFTVPGDDSTSGNATFYDVRYDTIQITDLNFRFANKAVGTGLTKAAGVTDSIDVTGLQGEKTYYFAIKVGDEVLNLSPIATASATTPAPARISFELDTLSGIVKDNDSLTLSLKIQNTGDADLVYKVSLSDLSQQEDDSPNASLFNNQNFSGPVVSAMQTTAAAQTSVLILYSGSSGATLDIQQKILAEGGFSSIDYLSVSSTYPTVSYLQNYDVVFVWGTSSFFSSSLIGDLLADYIDAGGNVVTAMYANTSYYIQGRFSTENYWALLPGSYTSSPQTTLGTINYPNHPIMKGVNSFDGGPYSARPYSAFVSTGAKVIAAWSDDAPLIVVRSVKGRNRVDLGFLPVSSDYYYEGWTSTSDGAKIIANALKYAASSYGGPVEGEATVSFAPDSGSVKKGETQTITVTLQTKNVVPGNYTMTIGIESNDPDSTYAEAVLNFSVQDLSAPEIGIRFFPNEAFIQNLGIVSVAHEKLYSPVMKAGVGSDTTQVALSLLDTTNFVYYSSYKLLKSGSYFAVLEASDSLGNHSRTVRPLTAVAVSPAAIAKIVSVDAKAQMDLPQYSIDKNLYIIASADDNEAVTGRGKAVGAVYSFSPQSLKLNKPALLMMRYSRPAAEEEASHYGIFTKTDNEEWIYVPTQCDAEEQTLYAHVNALGEFRIINSPDIHPEKYVGKVPSTYALFQNYPNPFNPVTMITYQLPVDGKVTIKVFNMLGQEVATVIDEVKTAGRFSVPFNGTRLASGVYLYRITAGSFTESKKMVLMK